MLEPSLSIALQSRASAGPDSSLTFGLQAPSCPEGGKRGQAAPGNWNCLNLRPGAKPGKL